MADDVNRVSVCFVCKLVLQEADEFISCSGVCDNSVHIKCSKLKKSELKLLQEGTKLMWFCDDCRFAGANICSLLGSIKTALLGCQDQVLAQNITIKDQNDLIKSLRSDIQEMKLQLADIRKSADKESFSSILTKTTVEPTRTSFSETNKQKLFQGNHSKFQIPVFEIKSQSQLAEASLGAAKNMGQPTTSRVDGIQDVTKDKYRHFDETSNLLSSDDIRTKDNWTVFTQKKKTDGQHNNMNNKAKAKVSYGTGKSVPVGSKLTGVARRKWIYIGRLQGKEVTSEDVLNHLRCAGIQKEVIINKLENKGNNSSFSIGVPLELYDKILDPEIWPDSVCIRDFNVRSFLVKHQQVKD
ncbi:hypothetical protein Zmor_014333 [Zophobas morio]|uniref:PHD-type domain-containing protein n=1 Tax=Zophobas morio TaxID=2755281 RepID=A0AA38IJE2_9CUCU|nr:hypothetical protein Zmor_014333 [Zophobas morio]